MKKFLFVLAVVLSIAFSTPAFSQPIERASSTTAVYSVASQAARLALSANVGDFAMQVDNGRTYILATLPASVNGNWSELTAGTSTFYYKTGDYGATKDATTLNAAVSDIGATAATLVVEPGAWTLGANVTVPSNITLLVPQGTTITVSGGFTLAINGPLKAGVYNIFTVTGTLTIDGKYTSPVLPNWFGAVGNNSTDCDTAFAKTLLAIATTGGDIYIPTGIYNGNLVLTGTTNVRIRGDGKATVIKPSSGIGLTCTSCVGVIIEDIKFQGYTTGLSLVGFSQSYVQRVFITTVSGDGIYIDGDSSTESSIRDVEIEAAGDRAVDYARTTATDTGGVYLTNVRAIEGGAGGYGFRFKSTYENPPGSLVGTAAYIFMKDCVADAFTNEALEFYGIFNFRVTGSYFTGTHPGGAAILIYSSGQGMLNNNFVNNGSATGRDIEVGGASNTIFIDNTEFAGNAAGTALYFDGALMSGILVGTYSLDNGQTFTNTKSELLSNSGYRNPFSVLTSNVAATGFLIEDALGGATPKKYFRVNSGALQVVNNAYTAAIFSLLDSGDLHLPTGGIRVGTDNGGVADTVTYSSTVDITANSTGEGTILMKDGTSRQSSGFIKVYLGTSAYYIPVFGAVK